MTRKKTEVEYHSYMTKIAHMVQKTLPLNNQQRQLDHQGIQFST